MKKIFDFLASYLAVMFFLYSIGVKSQTHLVFGKTESAIESYTFPTGDIMYFSAAKNTNTSNVCEGFEYRVQENSFVLKLVSTSLDSIRINGIAGTTVPRNFNTIEIATEKNGPYEDITSRVNIGPDVLYSTCRTLIAGNIGAPLGSFVRFTIMRTDQPGVANFNISEFEFYPIDTSTGSLTPGFKRAVKSKTYYSAAGVEVDENAMGFIVEKITYEDGSTESIKVLKQ